MYKSAMIHAPNKILVWSISDSERAAGDYFSPRIYSSHGGHLTMLDAVASGGSVDIWAE